MPDITPFNPVSYAEKLRDKIKSALVDIVPDEQWADLIKKEVEAFFAKKNVTRNYNNQISDSESEFSAIARQVLGEEAKKHIRAELETPGWADVWDNGRLAGSESLRKLLMENAPLIIASAFDGTFQAVLQQVRNNMINGQYR